MSAIITNINDSIQKMKKNDEMTELSAAVQGKIIDIKNVDSRLDTLNKNIVILDPIQQYLQSEEYITSTLEVLASNIISEVVENKDVQKLVDNLHINLGQVTKLMPSAADKFKFDIARAEAALKGFVLPLNDGGNFDELSLMGIEDKEEIFAGPISATKKALIAISGNAIPKEQYANAVKDKAIEILQQDPKNTPEKLEKYEKFIIQGDKNQKFNKDSNQFIPRVNKLSQVEFKALQNAATDTVHKISARLEKNNEISKQLEQIVLITNSSGIKKSEVIINKLNKLDSTYLKENSTKIATALKDINNKGSSLWEKFKQIFTGKNYLEERLSKFVDKHITLSDGYVVKTINDKIFSNALTNPEIAVGLTQFLNQNKDKVTTNPEFKNLIPVTGEHIIIQPQQVQNLNLAQLRKINPITFDRTIFEDSIKLRNSNIKYPQTTPHTATKNQEAVRSKG
ncbi:hypothetical protein [Rickettsia typhi]|uniref:Uncharacterized protein n=2 Tax=Rickettsia typhi TaxID=785 RepID=Q68WT0_RICTY|nr:hypothetical protein [Rickettsia typhi]AAU03912.1 rickettsial conserved hypothetical protein [Rickettsia typhi str. Wilmington]AFE54293.1 hypothetical protein RTTH1527_02140 [Rickettsia typhi str. TH1527]AFE55133.1 hypothetical protein RTB9991CWPP_02150 [Rickettsia typhi str. B9991CWPP]